MSQEAAAPRGRRRKARAPKVETSPEVSDDLAEGKEREGAEVPYRKLSVADKQIRDREAVREPAIACPLCETQTTVADLLRHIGTTCAGQRDPHPLSRWATWAEVLALGVSKQTLSKWLARGLVHSKASESGRAYLVRDVVKLIALQYGPTHRSGKRPGPQKATGKERRRGR